MAQIAIANILWRNNSPYGTFVAGDEVIVYWDDSTNALVVKKNGSTITSGNQIPVTFKYNNKTTPYYKTEGYFQNEICRSTSLMKFERISGFPYIVAIELQDHPTCAISDYVCNLVFDALPVITGATTATALDGAVTVTATSTQAIKYKLNSDFEYNDGTGQASGTFTGLGVGNYLVFARDAKNCHAVIGVNIPIAKTYGVKYRLEYYDNIAGFHHKTEIIEKDFVGSVTEVLGGDEPTSYSLRGEGANSRDKFNTLISGEITFKMTSEANEQYIDLYTNDPEKYRVRHYVDTGSGYELVFLGKMIAGSYQENYISPPFYVSVAATDGTPELDKLPFLDAGGNKIKGRYSQISVIAFILKKIGLDLPIRVAANIYADTMATTAADDPLDQAFVNCYRYYLKDIPTCRDVIDMILKPYGACLIQWGGYWNIIRTEERTADFDFRVFDDEGVYVSNGNYDPLKDLKNRVYSNRIVWQDRDQVLNILPGFGKLRLLYDLGRKKSILENGDFEVNKTAYYGSQVTVGAYLTTETLTEINLVAPDYTGFQIRATNTVYKTYEQLDANNVAIVLESFARGSYILSKSMTLKMGNTDKLQLAIRFAVTPPVSISTVQYVKVRFLITYGSYYLLDDGTWTTLETYLTFFVKTEDLNKYQELKILADNPDTAYIDGAAFNVKIMLAHVSDYTFTSLATFKALPTTTLKNGYRTEYYNATNILFYELRNSTKTADDINIVRPTDYNSGTNPYQWFLVYKEPLRSEGWKTKIDYVNVLLLLNGNEAPENNTIEQDMENDNTDILNEVLFHGSLVTTGATIPLYNLVVVPGSSQGNVFDNNFSYDLGWQEQTGFIAEGADIIYCGYLSDSVGVGLVNWQRDSRAGSKPLQNIYADMVSAQYNKPWRMLTGSFTGDILFAPIDTMNETMDGNRKYVPVSLSIDFKSFRFNSTFVEMTSTADADIDLVDPVADGAGFSTGFSLGFNS